ncbi:Polyadenylate-binding protein 7 [Sesamum alatum]|uniref:Polyadenylate-binding protein 7 n=1 Tax=Sesamum alatum TaxID=300844 RepID=A0AAE1Y7M9_9LAMI|nr:Polyadenylate-binding protein 7 [Sesamum alatum]
MDPFSQPKPFASTASLLFLPTAHLVSSGRRCCRHCHCFTIAVVIVFLVVVVVFGDIWFKGFICCPGTKEIRGNIDDEITDEDLRKHFSQCDTITSVKVIRNDKGLNKGFGFVCFSTSDEANKAVNSFRGFILHRKSLFVKLLRGKRKDKHTYSSPLGIRLGWTDNGFANRYKPIVQSSAVCPRSINFGLSSGTWLTVLYNTWPMAATCVIPNGPTTHKQSRGRMNYNVPQGSKRCFAYRPNYLGFLVKLQSKRHMALVGNGSRPLNDDCKAN